MSLMSIISGAFGSRLPLSQALEQSTGGLADLLRSSPGSALLERVGLNPQPLPPKEQQGADAASFASRMDLDDWCGTVPRRFPPLPPPVGPLAQLMDAIQGAR